MKNYTILYWILTGVILVLIANLWCPFMTPNDASVVNVYVTAITALILAMKNTENKCMKTVGKYFAMACFLVILIVFIFSLKSIELFEVTNVVNGVRTIGFIITLATFMINCKK